MSFSNYTELVSALQRWAQNADLEPEAYEDFVAMTEAHLNAELRVQDMSERWYTNTVELQPLYALPADSRGVRNIEIEVAGRRFPLKMHTAETLDAKYGWRTRAGQPEAYALTGLDVEIRPAPNGEYPMRILYYREIPPLSASELGNWVLKKYPNLYLYGGLHFLAEYVRDDEAAVFWGSRLSSSIAAATEADVEDRWSGGTPVMRHT